MEVKGEALITIPLYILKKFASKGYEKWFNALSPASRKIYESPISKDDWFPLQTAMVDPTVLMCELLFNKSVRGAWECGRFSADLERGARGLRIGFVRHFHETDLSADPEMAAALDGVSRLLTQEGAEVRTITLPPLHEFAAVQRVIMQAESWAIHANWLRERPGDYARATRQKLLVGAFHSAGDYVHAQQHRLRMIAAVDDAFRDADVLLTANSMEPACRIDDEAAVAHTYPRQARAPFNLSGHPAIALMCGLSKSGLPLSVQLVGRTHDEITLFRAAAAYERASEWHARRPPL